MERSPNIWTTPSTPPPIVPQFVSWAEVASCDWTSVLATHGNFESWYEGGMPCSHGHPYPCVKTHTKIQTDQAQPKGIQKVFRLYRFDQELVVYHQELDFPLDSFSVTKELPLIAVVKLLEDAIHVVSAQWPNTTITYNNYNVNCIHVTQANVTHGMWIVKNEQCTEHTLVKQATHVRSLRKVVKNTHQLIKRVSTNMSSQAMHVTWFGLTKRCNAS